MQAMLSLLSDDSQKVVGGCAEALARQGDRAESLLEQRLPLALGREARRIRSILARVRYPAAEEQLLACLTGSPKLERGALLLARLVDGGPEVDEAGAVLDHMAERADELLMDDSDPQRQLGVLRRVLTEEYALKGSDPGASRPIDALLHGVTSNRRGMPMPLCITWLLVARRLRIPLVGVNMPGHFLMRLDVSDKLLVLDAYSGGRVVDQRTWQRHLKSHNLTGKSISDLDADDREMLLRSLRNLVHLSASDHDRALALRCTRVLALESQARTV